MKTSNTVPFAGLLALLTILLWTAPPAAAQPGPPLSFRTFYEELSPYGDWVTHPAYGSVWVPDAGPGFQPYGTGGYWVMTEYGNTWVSDYAWGWAPFHYGRWFYDDYYGWAWVPGHEWGPAWVAWRSGGGYYGWAPLGPGVNIRVNVVIPARHWVFVPQQYITYPQPYRYCAPRHQVVNIYHNSVHVHNTYRHDNQVYVYGPDRDDIARASRREVPVYRVEEARRPGRTAARNGAVEVYRPRVTPQAPGNARPARGDTYANDRENPEYASPRGRVAEEGYRESSSSPGENAYRESSSNPRQAARPQPAPAESRTEFPGRSPRETGGYGPSPGGGRARPQAQPEPSPRARPQAQPEPSPGSGQQTRPESSTRGEQLRPARQPSSPAESSPRESSGQREAAGYSRPRRG